MKILSRKALYLYIKKEREEKEHGKNQNTGTDQIYEIQSIALTAAQYCRLSLWMRCRHLGAKTLNFTLRVTYWPQHSPGGPLYTALMVRRCICRMMAASIHRLQIRSRLLRRNHMNQRLQNCRHPKSRRSAQRVSRKSIPEWM